MTKYFIALINLISINLLPINAAEVSPLQDSKTKATISRGEAMRSIIQNPMLLRVTSDHLVSVSGRYALLGQKNLIGLGNSQFVWLGAQEVYKVDNYCVSATPYIFAVENKVIRQEKICNDLSETITALYARFNELGKTPPDQKISTTNRSATGYGTNSTAYWTQTDRKIETMVYSNQLWNYLQQEQRKIKSSLQAIEPEYQKNLRMLKMNQSRLLQLSNTISIYQDYLEQYSEQKNVKALYQFKTTHNQEF